MNHTRPEADRDPLDEPVHGRFERLAAACPGAVAARFREHALSYGELAADATRLAQELIRRGVRPETMVAVCLPPSLDVLIAMLAIFKAGGVYVPLDPTFPPALLASIVDETQPALTLTFAALAQRALPDGVPVLCLDRPWQRDADQLAPVRLPEPELERSAYVLYTSGTTGRAATCCRSSCARRPRSFETRAQVRSSSS